jgi:plasmid replication initiation protein
MSSPSAAAELPSRSSSAPPRGSAEANSDPDDIVVKANQLIRGRINWTKLEHRVVAMLVAQLKREDDAFEMQRVHISDLMDMSQTSSRDIYNRAEEVCRKLLNQKVHVRTRTDDGRRVYQGYNCLSTCRYVEGSGYIEAKFNDDMEPFLLQLKRQFTMYRLQNFMQLSSQHSMRMYELIKMQEGLRHLHLSVEELREVLCCEHTYERFSDFRRHVLERARTEIAETCDTYYTYVVERDGRTPKWVRFLIHRREEDSTPAPILREEERAPAAGQEAAGQEAAGQEASGQEASGQEAAGEARSPAAATGASTDAGTEPSSAGPSSSDPPSSGSASSHPSASGSSSAGPSSPLRRAKGRYNLHVSVLARLGQERLDDVDRAAVRSALERGKESAAPVAPDARPAAVAEEVVARAAAELRGD